MTSKEILLAQLAACHNEVNWFVPINNALKGLTGDQAEWHDHSTNNSIRQIVSHLIFWNERYLHRFKGMAIAKMEGGNKATFEGETADWPSTVSRIDAVMNEWRDAVMNADEAKLNGPMSSKSENSWYSVIANITIHNAYHIGQIVYIRKLQGSWNDEQGVK